MANSSHKMKRLESRKSHSWWWDSHISPKNSKWLAENLEEMDQSVKRMLKLIEEDGDSFAKKAEMYYQKRPELVAHVEEFYRMYRSLAERYDNLTGELRKNIPSDLHSQGSGISDCSSELSSPLPTPEKRPSRRRSSNRAAGFDFFLGSGGGSSDFSRKESYTMSSSSSGSESESDGASSRNNFLSSPVNGNGEGLHQRIIELEAEVCEVKEKLRVAEENSEALAAVAGNGNHEDIVGTNTWYDEELKVASEKLRLSEEEILRLKAELNLEHGHVLELQEQIAEKEASFRVSDDKIKALEKELVAMRSKLETSEEVAEKLRLLIQKNESSEGDFDSQADPLSSSSFSENREIQINLRSNQVDGLETRITDQEQRVKALEEELEIRNDQLQLLEEEIGRLNLELEKNKTFVANTDNLKVWLESCEKEVESKKVELAMERKRILDLQEQIRRFEIIVLDRDNEIMKVKVAISEAEENFTLEKSQLHEKIFFISDSQAHLEGKLKEWELKVRSLEEEIKRIEAEKLKIQDSQVARETVIQSEIKQLRADITEKGNHVEVLNKSLDALKLKFDMLVAEKDQLNAKVHTLTEEACSRDDIIHQKDEHLHRLHMEHVDLIAGSEGHRKLVRELKTRVETLEEEVDRQQTVISEGAEEKREAIRQLCFSLEHYRNGYHELRQAFLVHKRPTVLAS